jgi:hypothetical protein
MRIAVLLLLSSCANFNWGAAFAAAGNHERPSKRSDPCDETSACRADGPDSYTCRDACGNVIKHCIYQGGDWVCRGS